MIGYWNDAEDKALQGLSADALAVYLRGIRRFADKNGVAGIQRRISEQSLAEVLEFIPDRSSKLKPRKAADISRQFIRSRLSELERAGLIKKVGTFVFECCLAAQDKSDQKRNNQGATNGATQGTANEKPKENQQNQSINVDYSAMINQMSNPVFLQTGSMSNPHHLSPNIDISAAATRTHARIAKLAPSHEAFQMRPGWSPTTEFEDCMGVYGTPKSLFPDAVYNTALMEFVSYWSAQDDSLTQGGWEHKWRSNLLRLKAKLATQPKPQRRPPPKPSIHDLQNIDYYAGLGEQNADGSYSF